MMHKSQMRHNCKGALHQPQRSSAPADMLLVKLQCPTGWFHAQMLLLSQMYSLPLASELYDDKVPHAEFTPASVTSVVCMCSHTSCVCNHTAM